jgi:flavin-dependent dehydrogenase
VRRKLAKEITNNEHACSAVRAYYKDVTGIQAGVNEFHFFNELLPGYFWIFPLDNGWVNIGFGILQKKIAGTKRPVNLRHALNKIITEMPSIAPRFENATMMHDIKSFGLPLGMQQFNISGKRFMLCGDAASLIDPLQGHGIDHAMNSGHIAGLQAIECFASKQFNTEFMQEYDRDVYKKIGGELSRNTFLLRLLSRAPWLLNLVTTIGQHQRFIERIVRFLKI